MLWDDKIAQPSNTEQQLQAVVSTITRPCGGLEYVLIRPGVSRAGCAASGECGNQTRDLLNGEPFWMGKTEVTVKEYLDVMSSSGLPIPVPPSFNDQWHLKSHPMVNVALAEAARFCALTGGRLPFNKEWDIAAATGGLNNVPVSRDSANYGNEACCSGFIGGRDKWEYTAPVGSFPPNSFGLYDMLGNVWEWVLPEQARAVNRTGETAFLRGGSWLDRAWYLSSSYRRSTSGTALRTVGFRCVFNDHGDDRQTSGVAPGGSHRERR
jgi:formylglycine-generating enzyme required for sulfatase activity